MKRLILIFIVTLFLDSAYTQGSITFSDKNFIIQEEKDLSIQNWIQTDSSYWQLNPQEKDVIYWINYVRKQPQQFYSNVLVPFLEQFPEIKSPYTKSLKSELLSGYSRPMLKSSYKLNKVAASHAQDLGSSGINISHSSSSGQSFQQRMTNAGLLDCISENIYEGRQDALIAIIFLLIDQGVKNVGHRKNMLDPDMKFIGVSFSPIKKNPSHAFMVQDFSCE
ncbi:MAG TPA: CAP domain-containing protein [Agriterribacter sp.]|nr:CAP domain-containing protein [Agriterribacter sp.]